MKYNIYFHNDFDGRASAAVVLAFLRSRGDEAIRYIPLDFSVKPHWASLALKKPAAIVDFLYHPDAVIWFDHHETSFIKKEWKNDVHSTPIHAWNVNYPSCCSLVLATLVRRYGFKATPHFKELARWLDVVDGGNFSSALETIKIEEPALRLMHYIEAFGSPRRSLAWLIEAMSRTSIRSIVRDPRLGRFTKKLYRMRDNTFHFYEKHLQIFDRIGFLDLTGGARLLDLRLTPYYLDPKLLYFVFTKKHGDQYGIHVGANPWRRKESKVHLGEFFRKYGGGGHEHVGAVRLPKKEQFQKVLQEVLEYLKKRATEK